MNTKDEKPEDKIEFKDFLQDVLNSKNRVNPKYSLRSFARQLGVSPSALSEILNGKRKVTTKMKGRIGQKLGLTPIDLNSFKTSNLDCGIDSQYVDTLSLKTFRLVSEWYHFAILELTWVDDFVPKVQWVANRLDISVKEVQAAIETMTKLGLLEIKKNKWIDKSEDVVLSNINERYTTLAHKKLQQKILEQSQKALWERPLTERSHSSMTMAISPKDIYEAKRRIKKFRRELNAFLTREPLAKDVYTLNISLFPVTTKKSKKSEAL